MYIVIIPYCLVYKCEKILDTGMQDCFESGDCSIFRLEDLKFLKWINETMELTQEYLDDPENWMEDIEEWKD